MGNTSCSSSCTLNAIFCTILSCLRTDKNSSLLGRSANSCRARSSASRSFCRPCTCSRLDASRRCFSARAASFCVTSSSRNELTMTCKVRSSSSAVLACSCAASPEFCCWRFCRLWRRFCCSRSLSASRSASRCVPIDDNNKRNDKKSVLNEVHPNTELVLLLTFSQDGIL